jgi:hypothetical protein
MTPMKKGWLFAIVAVGLSLGLYMNIHFDKAASRDIQLCVESLTNSGANPEQVQAIRNVLLSLSSQTRSYGFMILFISIMALHLGITVASKKE